jgi:tRNA pseudouridine55 synthase
MSRRKKGRLVNGIILLDKPSGITSNRALQTVRRLFDARKAGHTGTLDPFATGMLPLCMGEASKTAAFMIDSNKTYLATAKLGAATDTGDIDGEITLESDVPELSKAGVMDVLKTFVGEIEQVPPMYSALKHEGQALYKLARQGKTVERKPRTVIIHELRLLELDENILQFEVRCSKGTYIRTLAEDIASVLGTCAHLVALRRLCVEPFNTNDMISLAQLEADAETGSLDQHLMPLDAGLPDWPIVQLDAKQAIGFGHGNPQFYDGTDTGQVRVYGPEGQPLGLGICEGDGRVRAIRVFNLGAAEPVD